MAMKSEMSDTQKRLIVITVIIGLIVLCASGVMVMNTIYQSQRTAVPTVETYAYSQLGLLITYVDPASPAAVAGLKRGQIILELDGEPIDQPDIFQRIVLAHQAGDVLRLLIFDGQAKHSVAVVLAERPYVGVQVAGPGGYAQLPEGGLPTPAALTAVGPATVARILPNTPAETADLQAGDVVTAVDGQAILSRDELLIAMSQTKPGDTIVLIIRRGPETVTKSVLLTANPNDANRGFMGVELVSPP